jgi:hypothetical protein
MGCEFVEAGTMQKSEVRLDSTWTDALRDVMKYETVSSSQSGQKLKLGTHNLEEVIELSKEDEISDTDIKPPQLDDIAELLEVEEAPPFSTHTAGVESKAETAPEVSNLTPTEPARAEPELKAVTLPMVPLPLQTTDAAQHLWYISLLQQQITLLHAQLNGSCGSCNKPTPPQHTVLPEVLKATEKSVGLKEKVVVVRYSDNYTQTEDQQETGKSKGTRSASTNTDFEEVDILANNVKANVIVVEPPVCSTKPVTERVARPADVKSKPPLPKEAFFKNPPPAKQTRRSSDSNHSIPEPGSADTKDSAQESLSCPSALAGLDTFELPSDNGNNYAPFYTASDIPTNGIDEREANPEQEHLMVAQNIIAALVSDPEKSFIYSDSETSKSFSSSSEVFKFTPPQRVSNNVFKGAASKSKEVEPNSVTVGVHHQRKNETFESVTTISERISKVGNHAPRKYVPHTSKMELEDVEDYSLASLEYLKKYGLN